MAPPIIITTIQTRTLPTLASTLTQLAQQARAASARGAHLALFPEAYLGGYPRGTHFDALVGSRTDQGREEFYQYFEQCPDFGDGCHEGEGEWRSSGGSGKGDGTREFLENVARETGVFLVVGCVERVGGTLYCAVVYVCPREGLVGKRRKLMPTGTERVMWGFGSASTLKAIHTTLNTVPVVLAAAICWESYMPLLRYQLYSQHVQIYLAPTADGRESWISTMRHIAMEGRCYVVGSNQYVPDDEEDGVVGGGRKGCRGGSCVVNPLGEVVGKCGGGDLETGGDGGEGGKVEEEQVGKPLWGRQGWVDHVVEDLHKDIVKAKMDFDVVGHYKGPWRVVEADHAIRK